MFMIFILRWNNDWEETTVIEKAVYRDNRQGGREGHVLKVKAIFKCFLNKNVKCDKLTFKNKITILIIQNHSKIYNEMWKITLKHAIAIITSE